MELGTPDVPGLSATLLVTDPGDITAIIPAASNVPGHLVPVSLARGPAGRVFLVDYVGQVTQYDPGSELQVVGRLPVLTGSRWEAAGSCS